MLHTTAVDSNVELHSLVAPNEARAKTPFLAIMFRAAAQPQHKLAPYKLSSMRSRRPSVVLSSPVELPLQNLSNLLCVFNRNVFSSNSGKRHLLSVSVRRCL